MITALWHRLLHDKGYVALDGFHSLKHAIRFDADIPAMITDDKSNALHLARQLAPDVSSRLAQDLIELPKVQFEDLVTRVHPTRVASIARIPDHRKLRDGLELAHRTRPIIVLENPRNLGNIGAVIRLAAGFDSAGVLTIGTVNPWHTNVLTGSAGLHFATTVISAALDDLPKGPLFALDPDGEDIRSVEIPDNALLAFGSERSGISIELRSRADRLVSIPMRSRVSSYNLATSVAMTLFHWASSDRDEPLSFEDSQPPTSR